MVIKSEHILQTAAQVLARRPDATLQTIADAAGISRTTIFNRYPTRDDLLNALARDTLERVAQVMAWVPHDTNADVGEVLVRITDGLMPLGSRTALLRLSPDGGSALDAHWARAATPLALYFASLQSAGHLRSDHPVRWLVASYVGLVFAAWDEVSVGELGHVQAVRLVVSTWLQGSTTAAVGEGGLA